MRTTRRITFTRAAAATAVLALTTWGCASAAAADGRGDDARARASQQGNPLAGYKHLVVIYEENHSFDSLYAGWGQVGADRIDNAPAAMQVDQHGTAYTCLAQNDVNLTSPSPLATTCTDAAHGISSAFPNRAFTIDDYISATATTCPAEGVFAPNGVLAGSGLAGGCTRDLVHRFYQEQYQLDGGKLDRYVNASDAVGLSLGRYNTQSLPIYQYLHGAGAPHYVIADRFFQAAFGGSFLNHQFLISARAPLDTSIGTATPSGALNSVITATGMPGAAPLYTPTATGLVDKQLTQVCPGGGNDPVAACGNYAVNTIQPSSAPFGGGARLPLIDDTAYPNIGDRMSAAGVSWAWYSGGWDAANAGTPGKTFQFHHQPFNYFAAYAPGQPGREHLKDETAFLAAASAGTLPAVSFVKPYGVENEHPGYASEPNGSSHLVDLLQTILAGPDAETTLVVVTYDEFGGQADHVAPPTVDKWGPGTRIPALLVSARFERSGVDHTVYDTTSILATIERAYRLAPLSSRDAQVNDLRAALRGRD